MDLTKDKETALKVKKFLTFVLKHKPFFYKVRIDSEGFADIHYLTVCIKKKLGIDVTKEDIVNIVKRYSGGIFKLNAGEDRIAARSGHTFVFNGNIPDGFEPVTVLPGVLYCTMDKDDFYSSMNSDSIPLSNKKIMLVAHKQNPNLGQICLEVNTQKVLKKSEFYYNKQDTYFTKFITRESVTLHV